ncbi:D-alanyl-D-alanine carboxypeptidase/D-alanyl-D-alanine-endopeptidase [Geothrix sp. PMB-07]|uniref:D-alanyl-D-alanine carboxypeptidase/D-alanyl-D-alanine-endopeptidase n=1 Tax=Geothrix sp. PMB-07 TaxID=3068640 RepID=UPI002741B878|nr:D-alanyl-D-alanine carboxypeptidase [Geothrix sp. PMB-07]WLT30398.1 D-alanyl-D-alanine carboxypeptidase [Geothrix sp. PMB-07]
MSWKVTAALLLGCLSLSAQGLEAWARRLEARGISVSAGLWDVQTGKALERFHEDTALVPASTTKVVSTYALLKTLKPDSALETEIWGDLKDGVIQGNLIFKGGGDPLLVSERIWLLAQALKKQGLQRVTGSIVLDQSAFDGQRQPQGWENTTADTLPSVLPLSVNFNRNEAGRQAADPERQSRDTLQQILQETGIAIEGRAVPAGTPRKLLSWPSPPLRALVMDINKWSNNFMVEMLVRSFGGGSWPRGVKRIQDFYRTGFDLGPEAVRITDGSGLSKDNRLSARTLAIILRGAYHDFDVGPEFVASLKVIGGEPWKLRMKDPNLTRRVRVKSGHLDQVTSLCGYLQTLDGRVRVFAILLNGPSQDEDIWEQVSRWAN